MAETNLAKTLVCVDEAASYDTNIKFLLADKQVLARILKYAVSEFQDLAIDEIMACIGDEIEIGTKPIDAGLSNLGRVHLAATEDNVPGEGVIFFDIRFSAYLGMSEMKFLINIEAQKSSDPKKLGYHLENRVIFYLARMISAQKQTEFYHSDYDSLKPVRSIWICMDSGDDGDLIEEIGLGRRTVFGNSSKEYHINLMKGIMVHVRSAENRQTSKNILINMLEQLLSGMDLDEKKRILTEEYGMLMTAELEGRMRTMCNLSEDLIERAASKAIKEGMAKGIEQGIEQGIKQGIEQGIKQGIETERTDAIERMLKAGATKQQIVSYGYTEEEFLHVERLLVVSV